MTSKRRLSMHAESWALRSPFRISGHLWESSDFVVCEIEEDGRVGRGEGVGIYYLDETPATMLKQIAAAAERIEGGASREALLQILGSGGARNAVDCALWDLESQQAGRSAWELAGVAEGSVETVFTVGLESEPTAMARKAVAAPEHRNIKVKLDADRPVERIAAIRQSRPDARLVVDVNQGWSFEELQRFAPALKDLGVAMIEQPLPRGKDAPLAGYRAPLPICADESCIDLSELDGIAARYQMLNIKLDKCGGLTAALALAKAARAQGLGLMVGNMVGTSLSMAPAHIIAMLSDFVDLDGPLLLTNDRPGGMRYAEGKVYPPKPGFWGKP
jgi:L-Ala-D/L-Glu epimerase